jgi:inosine-uridine nucleoside N-ribohydrolase
MSKIPVWIDTDTGVDDAVALLTAVYLERKGLLEIRGISAVCGNAELDKTFENARNVM